MDSTYEGTHHTNGGFFNIQPTKVTRYAHLMHQTQDLINELISEFEEKKDDY